jgi:cysteine desulfurase
MTGPRAYLDWNATAPLRAEARAAMLAAMDVLGNPSSVHAEGRAAKALLERARAQVAEALGADGAEVVFTSGASEAAALALRGRGLVGAAVEHDCVLAWIEPSLPVDAAGRVTAAAPRRSVLQAANSETGVVQALPRGLALIDAVQAIGRLPFAFDGLGADAAIVSAHKLGGPKGIGALVLRRGVEVEPLVRGGGQEAGRRAGTENLIGAAGFAATLASAGRELADGSWERVAELRNLLEAALEDSDPDIIFVGQGAPRLPNTSCFAVPGWRGETQVMQMDLAGFAVSAGSACSSGKVRPSGVLRAMGYDEGTAASAIRVSLGPDTTRAEIEAFAGAWTRQRRRFARRAA